MAKMKVKKEMTLPEIIQWGWDNGIKNEEFMASLGGCIYFDEDSYIDIEEDNLIAPEETFEVEVEEEITEETVISRLLEVRNAVPSNKTEWKDLKILKSYLYGNHSISEIKNEYSVAIYMLNDDMTMTLLWKDGEMVE